MRYLTPVRFEEASASVKKYTGGIIDAVYGLEKSAGDPDLYKKIKTDFYFDNLCTAQKIKDALSGGDFVTAHRLTHTLKGVATLIGAVPLSEAAYTLEKIYGETKTDEQALTVVEEQLELVLNELMADAKAERGGEQHAEIELDIGKARELIGRLELLLEDGNSDVIDLVDEIKAAFPRNLCGELVELISDYEFEEAQSALEALKRRAEVGVLT
jgi:HPt (histidine-containing phosphotransfer) domain-containing protein